MASRNRCGISGALVWSATVAVLLVVTTSVCGQASYSPYLFGVGNYFGGQQNLYNGLWWVQPQCHWGTPGYRNPSVLQCGTFFCPSSWYGGMSYHCPPPTLFSNSLQRCVHPVSLDAGSCKLRS